MHRNESIGFECWACRSRAGPSGDSVFGPHGDVQSADEAKIRQQTMGNIGFGIRTRALGGGNNTRLSMSTHDSGRGSFGEAGRSANPPFYPSTPAKLLVRT